MGSDYFEQSKEQLSKEYGVDVLKDVIFGRKGRVLLYTDITKNDDMRLHVISNSLRVIGLEDTSNIFLKDLFSRIDVNNKYAEVSGKEAYLDYVKTEMTAFEKDVNVSFPIISNNQRRWIHFDGYAVDTNPNIYIYLAHDISDLMNAEEKVFEKTHKDSLTGLFNRYAFDYHYGIRYKKEHLHILYMDIDNFKQINDRFNHKAGNSALVAFSNILKSLQVKENLFYRLGGDEFVGLIFKPKNDVLKIAEKIIKETKKITLPGENNNLTVSIGVIQATKREDPVRKADDVLYKAKKHGKDQYIFEVE